MVVVFLTLGVTMFFILSFLVDISVNLRRIHGELKKISSCDKIQSLK